jgi:hypothetical protein
VAAHTDDGESGISGEQKKNGILHPNKQKAQEKSREQKMWQRRL